jgi:tRNA G37 N-methylase TrmD
MQNIQQMYRIQIHELSLMGSHEEKLHRPRGTVHIKSTQIRWFSEQSDQRLDLRVISGDSAVLMQYQCVGDSTEFLGNYCMLLT